MEDWMGRTEVDYLDGNMARDASNKKLPPDEARVSRHDAALRTASVCREEFELALHSLKADHELTVPDVIEIALRYRGGGTKPGSKKAALEVISKRFLELVRSQAQIKQAAKARPW